MSHTGQRVCRFFLPELISAAADLTDSLLFDWKNADMVKDAHAVIQSSCRVTLQQCLSMLERTKTVSQKLYLYSLLFSFITFKHHAEVSGRQLWWNRLRHQRPGFRSWVLRLPGFAYNFILFYNIVSQPDFYLVSPWWRLQAAAIMYVWGELIDTLNLSFLLLSGY